MMNSLKVKFDEGMVSMQFEKTMFCDAFRVGSLAMHLPRRAPDYGFALKPDSTC
jgi:hypothetical protein